MLKYISILSFVCLTLSTSLFATIDVEVPSVMVLRADEHMGIIYSHELQKNQTIYGLAKFFNTDISRISAANPHIKLSEVQLNQHVNIPINTDMISSERNLSPSKSYIPVYYTVKAKDNLFRIAKVYFHQSIENVMNINNLKTMDLSIGQKILVGWYEYDASYKEKLSWKQNAIEVNTTEILADYPVGHDTQTPVFQKLVKNEVTSTPHSQPKVDKAAPSDKTAIQKSTQALPKKMEETKQEDLVSKEDAKSKEADSNKEKINLEELQLSSDPFENRNGIYVGDYEGKPVVVNSKIRAEWNMKSKDRVNLFALHSTAKINSFIEIYNPMLDTKVIAKVVGNLPPNAHKKNVELIISPKVAETLGAVDKRFYVKVRYVEDK